MTEPSRRLRDKLIVLTVGLVMSISSGIASGWIASQVQLATLATRVKAVEEGQSRLAATLDQKLDVRTHDALQSQTDQRLAAIQQQQQAMQSQLAQIYALMLELRGGRP